MPTTSKRTGKQLGSATRRLGTVALAAAIVTASASARADGPITPPTALAPATEEPGAERSSPTLPAPASAPQAYEPSGSRASDSGPSRMPYEEGDEVPSGYRIQSTPRWGMLEGGLAITGSFWVISMLSAVMLDSESERTVVDSRGGTRRDPEFASSYTPLFVPVVGPFATLATAQAHGTGAAILVLDGLVQTGGIAMAAASMLVPKRELVRRSSALQVAPVVTRTQTGLGMSGTM